MRLSVLALLAVSTLARAEVCAKLEYAELDAMPVDELVAVRCEYRANMVTFSNNLDTGSRASDLRNINAINRCAQEINRIGSILTRKYGLSGAELTRRCEKK